MRAKTKPSSRTDFKAVRSRLNNLLLGLMIGFLCVASALVFWSQVRGSAILGRDDNPRLIEAELRIKRGRILDADNNVLAETVGTPGDFVRRYPIGSSGAAIGYYSLRHGTSGIEDSFDTLLRGDTDDFWTNFWQYDFLHQIQEGRDLRLTLDTSLQIAANELIGDQKGAAILFSIPDMTILAMVSQPSFEADLLDQQFDELIEAEDAPLLNRVTQGQYQPGLVLQPFILAGALEASLLTLEEEAAGGTDLVRVNDTILNCMREVTEPITWAEVMQNGCPGGMIKLAEFYDEENLSGLFEDFGLLSAPDFPLETDILEEAVINDRQLALIGQDTLAVNPLQVAIALASLANGGATVTPKLLLASQNSEGEWLPFDHNATTKKIVLPQTAEAILGVLPVQDGVIEHNMVVLSGPEGSTNSWYLGLAPAGAPRYGVVVVVEDSEENASSKQIGNTLLTELLQEQ